MSKLKLTVKNGWYPGATAALVRDINPLDREELTFYTNNIFKHLKEIVDDMDDMVVSVTDERGNLWWLGGACKTYVPGADHKGLVWLLKTKHAKRARKADKMIMRKALDDVLGMIHDVTPFTLVGNVVWDQQKKDIRWLESVGFVINYADPGVVTRLRDGKQAIFYQFNKEIIRDGDRHSSST